MKTAELIDHIVSTANVDKGTAKRVLEALTSAIVATTLKGEEVMLPGFGKFKLKETPARQGRNPSTGAVIDIAAAKKLSFTQAKQVKESMAG